LENYIGKLIGNVVNSELHTPMYVIITMAEKHMPYGKLVGTTECITLYPRCHTNLGCYNWVHMYMYYDLPPYKPSHFELLQFIMAGKPKAKCCSVHQEIPCILCNL